MKKIMFNDRYGLTQAVLNGRKTMTRRAITNEVAIAHCKKGYTELALNYSKYQVDEVVAIAQSYENLAKWCKGFDLIHYISMRGKYATYINQQKSAGWSNKMFAHASLMPHHIRITNVRVERLQDLSDEDCLREGVRLRSEPIKYQEWSPEYTFGNGKYHAKYPRAAFAALIDCISGKGTWNSNPYVFVYEFELVD